MTVHYDARAALGPDGGKPFFWEAPGYVDDPPPPANGQVTAPPPPRQGSAAPSFPDPVPASALRPAPAERYWLCAGLLARGETTLLTSLWKTGKTTFLAHLFKVMAGGGELCGLAVAAARVLCVTEEPETRWAKRRDQIGLADNVEFLIRPFPAKPAVSGWLDFVAYLGTVVGTRAYDVLVLDPIVNLWPVRDENDASQVQGALMPLHGLRPDLAILLVHHNRKADGTEGTAGRGSGATMAFADTIVEFRRHNAADRSDRRRVLTGYGRDDQTLDELVIELTEEGGYAHRGNRREVRGHDLAPVLAGMLPEEEPGLSVAAILAGWPEPARPGRRQILEALERGESAGFWTRSGTGKRGDPFLYTKPLDAKEITL